jgi:two-component system, OmpR family, osmolarity sensor histidine kinase EnvZ
LKRLSLNLFWRTYILLVLLVLASVAAWLVTFRELDSRPRAAQGAQQIASLVNMSRAGLVAARDPIERVALARTLSETESVQVVPRKPDDKTLPYAIDPFTERVSERVATRLGSDTVMAREVNGKPGIWVGFNIANDAYWLQADLARVESMSWRAAAAALGAGAAISLLGAAVLARFLNRPLKRLSFAASRVREGDYDSQLDEETVTDEIREVNRGFNRMARELARVEDDRAIMLAGISHDLRTPLARLRLESEMSVPDAEARRYMAADIDQLDAIIDKFLDYARPGSVDLEPVSLSEVVDREISRFRDAGDMLFTNKLPNSVRVMADEVELGRVFQNLFENARRYGKSVETGIAEIEISAGRASDEWALVQVRDRGTGVSPDKLAQLTKPFFRGDAARTAATGAGLGLSVVEKTIGRMGGTFEVLNAPNGGLATRIRLKKT